MTPDSLAQLIRTVAVTELSTRDINSDVLPAKVHVERPRNPEHGDYATNLALQVAKKAGLTSREFAQALADRLTSTAEISSVDVAGPGFLNVRLAAAAQGDQILQVLTAQERYGHGDVLVGRKINLEFVSANPTGPIHLGGTRWAAVGDTLGRIFAAQGAEVTREYYFNDAGAQIDRFVHSLTAAAEGKPTPEDGYAGTYIGTIAAEIMKQQPSALSLPETQKNEIFREIGTHLMFDEIKSSLHAFGTDFDVFFHEDSLHASGEVQRLVEKLKQEDRLYFDEGAWWLRTTDYGDDKDRVVIKRDGEPAYIAGDIAYLQDKINRGFDLCLYLLGADHHGYVARLKTAAAALGHDPSVVEVLIGQMVNLVSNGKPVRMSKRAGTVVTLEDLVEAVGVDAARYELSRYSADSNVDIDLDLLRKHSNDNPVYYVQYAHARLCSLQRNAADLGIATDTDPATLDFGLLTHQREGELIRTVGEFPAVLRRAAELREPHRVNRYLESVAAAYHKFYDVARVLPQGDEQATALTYARLALCAATRQVLANGLALLGVSAPERM